MTFSTWCTRQAPEAPDPNLTPQQSQWKSHCPGSSRKKFRGRYVSMGLGSPPLLTVPRGRQRAPHERPGLAACVPLQQLLTIPTLSCFAWGESPFLCLLLGTDLKPFPSLIWNISSFFSVWGLVQHFDHKFFVASADRAYQLSQYYVWFYCHLYFWGWPFASSVLKEYWPGTLNG